MEIHRDYLEAFEGIARDLKKQAGEVIDYNGGLDGCSTDRFVSNLLGSAALIDLIVSGIRESNK